MSIENNLASIAKSLESIARSLETRHATPAQAHAPVQVPAAAPLAAQYEPAVLVPVAAPVPVAALPAPAAAAPVAAPLNAGMPPPPFAMSAPAAAVPFSDASGMQNYVMSSYQALGAEKGAAIQNVLAQIGCRALNEIKPEHYAALHAGIEALK